MKKRAVHDHDKEAKRQRLLHAVRHAFQTKPFHHISVSEIAKDAQVAKGTFYLYFPSREDAFLALYEDAFAEWAKAYLDGLERESAPLAPTQFADILLKACQSCPEFVALNKLLHPLIEDLLPPETVLAFKERSLDAYIPLRAATMQALSITDSDKADQLLRTIVALMIGLKQMAPPPAIATELNKSPAKVLSVQFDRDFHAGLLAVLS